MKKKTNNAISDREVVVLLTDVSGRIVAAKNDPALLPALEKTAPLLEHVLSTLIHHNTTGSSSGSSSSSNSSGGGGGGNGKKNGKNGGGGGGGGSGIGEILMSDNVIKLLDCAFKPARKVELCKELLVSVRSSLLLTD